MHLAVTPADVKPPCLGQLGPHTPHISFPNFTTALRVRSAERAASPTPLAATSPALREDVTGESRQQAAMISVRRSFVTQKIHVYRFSGDKMNQQSLTEEKQYFWFG